MKDVKQSLVDLKSGKIKLEDFFQDVTQTITQTLGSTRASIWSFNMTATSIECLDLYDQRDGKHIKGFALKEEDFPEYFQAVKSKTVVRAPHAHEHPDTKCFEELYFSPNDIYSLLDFVIMSGGKYVGVLCCEQCGDYKEWSEADVKYLQEIATSVGFAISIAKKQTGAQAA